MRKAFPGAAVVTTLHGAIGPADTTIVVDSAAGWPPGGTAPFVITINRNQPNEEKCLVASRAGTTLTVPLANRGYDGTSGQSHAVNETVACTLDANTIDEGNAHTNDVARDDHTQYLNGSRHRQVGAHQFGTGNAYGPYVTPAAIGTTAATGSSNTPAAADHVHAIPTGLVTSAMIADGTIATADLADGAVTSAKILDGTIATGDIADGAITSAKILDGTIATADLADSSVTSAKIADGSIVAADIASGAVTPAKLGTGICDGGHIEPPDGFSPSATGSFQVVTGSTVTITNPGRGVVIYASASGYMASTGSSDRGQARVTVSVDGGSTFSGGESAPEGNIGSGAGSAGRLPFSSSFLTKTTPTGTVQARLEYLAITGTPANHSTNGCSVQVLWMPA